MEPDKPAISQKEYLKRYLMKDKKPKVKKKKSSISSSTHLKRSVVIDDDINIDEIPRVINDTFSLDHLGDEAPQIVGIVDERPEEVKLEEKYKSGEWKPLKPENRNDDEEKMPDFTRKFSRQVQDDEGDRPPSSRTDLNRDRGKAELKGKSEKVQSYRGRSSGGSDASDLSPRRQNRRREDSEKIGRREDSRKSKERRRPTWGEQNVDSELPPPRSDRRQENSSRSERGKDNRRLKSSDGRLSKKEDQSEDSDLSPPRSNRRDKDKWKPKSKDSTSFRKRGKSDDSDLSPPRTNTRRERFDDRRSKGKDGRTNKSKADSSRWHERGRHRGQERASDDSGSDLNVPRRNSTNGDKERSSIRRGRSSPASRQRSNKSDEDSDLSPPRRDKPLDAIHLGSRKKEKHDRTGSDSDLSPPRNRGGDDSDLSPPRKSRSFKNNDDKRNRSQKLDQMQDGKRAGLQDAKSLKDELRILKEKEDEMFHKMDPELLGRSSAAVVRDRKTGLKRDLEKERQIERGKSAKNAVRQQKYEKWGKGLKQVREQEEKVADMVREMSKPLARYADDDDLERALKAQEREGDPMLEYIKRHQKESHSVDLTVGGVRKKYVGSYLPNRFNVAPGHRWDGVDRSNGYEQKWFEARNAKKAIAEEAWKWSSADM